MSISFDNLRIGHRYYIKNYGEETEFEVLEALEEENFIIKNLHTLEKGTLKDLVLFGKGKDFTLEEI
jgi:hypothetical protein